MKTLFYTFLIFLVFNNLSKFSVSENKTVSIFNLVKCIVNYEPINIIYQDIINYCNENEINNYENFDILNEVFLYGYTFGEYKHYIDSIINNTKSCYKIHYKNDSDTDKEQDDNYN